MSTFKCGICWETSPINDGYISCTPFNGNGDPTVIHKFCIDCMRNVAKSAIDDGRIAHGGVGLLCPSCNNIIPIGILLILTISI